MRSSRISLAALLSLTACSATSPGAQDAGGDAALPADLGCAPHAPPMVDCTPDLGHCPEFVPAGDSTAGSLPGFRGYGNQTQFHDPAVPNRIWLVYSHLEDQTFAADGGTAYLDAVSTHYARSDDQGATWTYQGVLWGGSTATNPATGQTGWFPSEVPSITAGTLGAQTYWFGVHLRYFLEAKSGYNPDVAGSWTIHVGVATSVAGLANAPEAILGSATTNAGWGTIVRLTSLSPEVASCFYFNNPVGFFYNGKLYVAAECDVGPNYLAPDPTQSKIVLFSTAPAGAPATWSWQYAGTLLGPAEAKELGVLFFNVSHLSPTAAGGLMLLETPIGLDGNSHGCLGFALSSLDPPSLRRGCDGKLVFDAVITSATTSAFHTGSCSYDPVASGIILGAVTTELNGSPALIPAMISTTLHP